MIKFKTPLLNYEEVCKDCIIISNCEDPCDKLFLKIKYYWNAINDNHDFMDTSAWLIKHFQQQLLCPVCGYHKCYQVVGHSDYFCHKCNTGYYYFDRLFRWNFDFERLFSIQEKKCTNYTFLDAVQVMAKFMKEEIEDGRSRSVAVRE